MSEGGLEERGVRPKQRRIVGDGPDAPPVMTPLKEPAAELRASRISEFRQRAVEGARQRTLEELGEIYLAALAWSLCRRSPAQPGETFLEVKVMHALEDDLLSLLR